MTIEEFNRALNANKVFCFDMKDVEGMFDVFSFLVFNRKVCQKYEAMFNYCNGSFSIHGTDVLSAKEGKELKNQMISLGRHKRVFVQVFSHCFCPEHTKV